MMQDMSINAEQVKALRESRGWSQEHLAEVSGLSLRTVQRVEAEGKGARETKLSLAAAFDVPIGRLCKDENNLAGSSAGVDPTAMTLLSTGTLLVVLGLIIGMAEGMLLAGVAIQISGLSVYGLDRLNGMRRAAGLTPLIRTGASMAGISLLVSAISVAVIGLARPLLFWWIPASVLAVVGALLVIWPIIMSRFLLTKHKE